MHRLTISDNGSVMEQRSDQNQNILFSSNYQQLYEYEHNLRIILERQLQIEKIKVKKLINNKNKGKVCIKCQSEINQQNIYEQNLVQNFKQFSTRMSSMMIKKNILESQDQLPHPISEIFGGQSVILSSMNENIPLIENFAIFGLNQNSIINRSSKNLQDMKGQVVYSLYEENIIKQAAGFIFPSGVAIKKLRGSKAKDKAIQIMSFCYTNLKSFILSFKANDMKLSSENYNKSNLLTYVNKQKNLFFICIGVRDYTSIQQNEKNFNLSLDNIVDSQHSLNPSQKSIHSQGKRTNSLKNQSSSLKSMDNNLSQIALSQRVFCITSYFPFFSFYEQILRSLINNIKMERLHIYKLNSEDMTQTIRQTDSKYQMQRIKELFDSAISQICSKKIQFNRSYQIKLINQQKITLLTDWNFAKTYFIDDWIFTILNLFTSETLLDLWTEIMLEEGKGVVFICENSHILTYAVYLFGNVLLKPFAYAYPVVNIVPEDQDFLDSPFPVIYGMFKKRKYVEQHEIIQRYNDRTYVFLSPDKAEIIYSAESKKNVQKRKPIKLKNQLMNLFKDLRNFRKKQTKSTKYQVQTQDYCFLSKTQQKQKCIEIIAKIHEFIQKQILEKIPTKVQIQQMNQNIDYKLIPSQKTPQTYLISKVVKLIKKSSKDPFLQRFLQTQVFSNFLLEENQII